MDGGKLKIAGFLYRAGLISRERFFETIWAVSGKKISYYINRLVLHGEENRRDLFQEIMLKIYSGLENCDTGYGINAWIYRIARNHCIDYLRGNRQGNDFIDTESIVSLKGNPEDIYLAEELAGEIRQAVEGLSGEERELAFLRYYEKMGFAEMGEVTGMNANTLKTKMGRISRKLRHRLRRYHDN